MKRTPLRPISRRRRNQQHARQQVVAQVHDRDRYCRFWDYVWDSTARLPGDLATAPKDCCGPLDVHEIIPRSAWALGYLEPTNCVLLCRGHHAWVGDNPAEAHRMGLHGFSWERPA